MKIFYWVALNIFLLSACNSNVVKEAPSLTDVNSGDVIQARAKIIDLQKQLNALKIAPAINSNGKVTGKTVWVQLGGKCLGKTWYHKTYCPDIQALESQIQSHQAIVNPATRSRVAYRGDKKIFPVLPSTAKVVPKARIPGGIVDSATGQPAQPVQNCEGMPANVAPRVLNFLSCKVVQIIAQPDRVDSFMVGPRAGSDIPEKNRLGSFPIAADGQGLHLDAPNLKKFQSLVFAESSYVFGMEKRCRFRPKMGLHFVKGHEAVEIIFSVSCPLWLFIYGNDESLEDFDPILGELAFLNALFSQQPVLPL